MSEKIIIALGVIGSIASIFAFFGINSSDLPRAPVAYIPVGISALVSAFVAANAQWKLWSSARLDFHINSPEKRLRNTALIVSLLCLVVFGYLITTNDSSSEISTTQSSDSA